MAETEQEHLENARAFWESYRFYILSALALLLTAIAGFTYQHSHTQETRQAANEILFSLLQRADEGDLAQAETLFTELQDSGYQDLADLAAFPLVSLYIAEERGDDASQLLENIILGSDDSGLRALAALRQAEVKINAGDTAAAIEILETTTADSARMSVLFEDRLGDAHYAAGDYAQAAARYTQAANLAAEGARYYLPLLNIKLSALRSVRPADGGAEQ